MLHQFHRFKNGTLRQTWYLEDWFGLRGDVHNPKNTQPFSFPSEKFGQLDIVVANEKIELIEKTPILELQNQTFIKYLLSMQ